MTRRALMGVAATFAIVAAGIKLEPDNVAAPRNPAAATPSPASTATPNQSTPRPPTTTAAATIAETYVLSATNWTARTYRQSIDARGRLGIGRLAASLRAVPPLRQLRNDEVARLGAVLRHHERRAGRQALVDVDVEELHLALGSRSRQTVTYEVRLRRSGAQWRVTRFTAVRGGR